MALASEGKILDQTEGRLLGLDAAGNLVLDTLNHVALTPAAGFPQLVGKGIPYGFGITNGAGASANIANVNFQLQDVNGVALAGVYTFYLYLSDSPVGAGITATTPSGGIAAVSTDGAILDVGTTSKSLTVVTNAAGLFELAITDTAKTGFYPVAVLPNGAVQVGAQLTTASYHS
jgi:hypothetical protein